MLSVKKKNKSKFKKTRKEIIKIFDENMFKYAGYREALPFSKKIFNLLIDDAVASENITKTEINTACKDKQNEDEKKEIAALLLSFLYVFIDPDNLRSLGPGDIAVEHYFHLTDGIHTEMTRLFNDLTNASFDRSIFHLPAWFTLPRRSEYSVMIYSSEDTPLSDALPPTISRFELQRYQEFWNEYNNQEEKITFFCQKEIETCTEEDFDLYKNPETPLTRIRQADLLSAPCHDISIAKQFKFRKVDIRKIHFKSDYIFV